MYSPTIKIYPVFVIATVEMATRMEIASSVVGVVLATLGGGLAQMRRAESQELTLGQTVAEWGLSAIAGFIAHTTAMQTTSDPWLIWTGCVVAGLAGSSGLAKYLDYEAKKKDDGSL
ncbi:MAG: hypothetical protein AAGB04_00200 [Pseudomonadota bacterium]